MRFFPILRQASATAASKQTTGLYGLPVHPNPRPVLITAYNQILHSVSRLPEESAYRKSVEAIASSRLAAVEKYEDVHEIEKAIGGGQIEELIHQAEAELQLVTNMESWKAWSPLEEKPVSGQWEK